MSYIEQFIKESQVTYPEIFKTPLNVLSHLLFVNGNGYSIINGNPIVEDYYNKKIPFVDYYSDEKFLVEILEKHELLFADDEIEENFERIKRMNPKLSKIELWQRAEDDYQIPREQLFNLDKHPIELNNEYWIAQMLDSPYFITLNLAPGYFLAEELNEKTEPNFMKVTKSLIEAYIHYFENFSRYSKGKKNPFDPRGNAITQKNSSVKEDLKILKQLHNKFSKVTITRFMTGF